MSLNGLTGSAGLKFGPLVVETLVKHYLERFIAQKTPTTTSDGVPKDGKQDQSIPNNNLRREELLYDQAFTVVKDFMLTASRHTVEELQQFSNTRTPSPPWVKVLRVVIPITLCDQAAKHLIDALGGETATKDIVGGTKWWQIRGVDGVGGEWIVTKKDWKEAERREKSKERRDRSNEKKERERPPQESNTTDSASTEDTSEPNYTPDMDEQRCILYLHGGGYYFGSVDQERYSIQRFARKINGRVFAINYRLSPQYPFPCAIQDALAAYLYLIEPPPEAKHKPVKPQHIVIMGDSAGGGLALAALQVIRDSGLPQCGGGVLISPWCDLSHSFPSIHTNTETDIIPDYGLSMHKPSILWPPPDDVESGEDRQGIRHRLRGITGSGDKGRFKSFLRSKGRVPRQTYEHVTADAVTDADSQMDLEAATSAPSIVDGQGQKVVLETKLGETLTVDTQIQLYAPNNLLSHPLVSHVRAYLGGLPPLFFIAGDQEVLRDEIIYTAHRAANPSKYPILAESKRLYPKITDFAARYPTPTKVHLQVYDGCAHDLPILFAFTTPAKYCFRAIASFCRFATGMQPLNPQPPSPNGPPSPLRGNFFGGSSFTTPPEEIGDISTETKRRKSWWGGEKASSLSKKASGIDKKPEKEKQNSGKEKPGYEPAKGKEAGSKGHNLDEGTDWVRADMQTKSEQMKEGVKSKGQNLDEEGVDQAKITKVEVIGEVVIGNESLPVGEDETNEVHTVDKQLKVETVKKTGTGDDTVRSLRGVKSHCSLKSNKSSKDSTKSFKKRWSLMIPRRSRLEQIPVPIPSKGSSGDVAGPRFGTVGEPEGERCAGSYPPIYQHGFVGANFIRERVSIRGVIRPLEPETKLPAFQLEEDHVGAICERSLRRYIQGKTKYDNKFSGTLKGVKKERKRNLKLARKESDKFTGFFESSPQKIPERTDNGPNLRVQKAAAGSWGWPRTLDQDEDPPPSSIVSRRDTSEARQLAMVADLTPEHTISGNNLWQHLVTFLTVTPEKKVKAPTEREHPKQEAREQVEVDRGIASTPSEIDIQIDATAKVTTLTQTNDITLPPKPLNFGPTITRPRAWLYWTRGSLWKEKFRVNNPSKTPRRGQSITSMTPVSAPILVSTLA